jgi:hypothetical protein
VQLPGHTAQLPGVVHEARGALVILTQLDVLPRARHRVAPAVGRASHVSLEHGRHAGQAVRGLQSYRSENGRGSREVRPRSQESTDLDIRVLPPLQPSEDLQDGVVAVDDRRVALFGRSHPRRRADDALRLAVERLGHQSRAITLDPGAPSDQLGEALAKTLILGRVDDRSSADAGQYRCRSLSGPGRHPGERHLVALGAVGRHLDIDGHDRHRIVERRLGAGLPRSVAR